jgi:cell division protein FtsZ
MLIKPNISQIAKIKVVGVGGAGCNAINSMISISQIKGVEFIAVNTDAQALLTCLANTKIQIGEELTKGLGSGGNPETGRDAAEESRSKLEEFIRDADMIFITSGMGGGTGTGASPIIAEMAKKAGILTVAVVTKPFFFEGSRRSSNAEDGIANLRDKVDTLIIIPNQKLLESVDKQMTLIEAFKTADSVLSQGVQGISDIITTPGFINVDFADVKTVMKDSGSALMGIGVSSGENRAEKAAQQAISSPLLEVSIEGAKGVLFNFVGGEDMLMSEIDEAAKIITKAVDREANIIFGATIDKNLKDQVKITVIATGFDESKQAISNLSRQFQHLGGTPSQQPTYGRSQSQVGTSTSAQPNANIQNNVQADDKTQSPTPMSTPTQPQTQAKPVINSGDFDDLDLPKNIDDENDPFDIPAFLRQNKGE